MRGDEAISKSVAAWLRAAEEDAHRRGLSELKPLLESLAASTLALRRGDWNEHVPSSEQPGRP